MAPWHVSFSLRLVFCWGEGIHLSSTNSPWIRHCDKYTVCYGGREGPFSLPFSTFTKVGHFRFSTFSKLIISYLDYLVISYLDRFPTHCTVFEQLCFTTKCACTAVIPCAVYPRDSPISGQATTLVVGEGIRVLNLE